MARSLLILLLAASASGCRSTLFKHPPTPASEVTREELAAEPVPPGERYYLLLFGSQSVPKRLVLTHTWCTAVRVTPSGEIAEQVSISWMPRTLAIRALRFWVEPGVNLDLRESLDLVGRTGQVVTLYGPYEVPATLFRRLRLQRDFLESGAIGYQGFDLIGEAAREGNGSNCIHAITDADPKLGRAGYLLAGNGRDATRYVRNRMALRGVFIDPRADHDWLLPALGLDPAEVRRGWPGVWALSSDLGLIR